MKNENKFFIKSLSFKIIPGYTPYMSQIAFVANLSIDIKQCRYKKFNLFDTLIKKELPDYNIQSLDKNINNRSVADRIIRIVNEIMKMAYIPVFQTTKFMIQKNEIQLIFPNTFYEKTANQKVINWVLRILNDYRHISDFKKLFSEIKMLKPAGVNTYFLLKSANDSSIPYSYIYANTYQFGWGSKARLFSSTSTDKTSMISMELAQNKQVTSRILRSVGLPVPDNIYVSDETQAIQAAERLGYPVVVKPTSLDQGKGVAARLQTLENVRRAYKKAQALSASIMVEKHFEGQEYRLHVLNGEVYFATQRIPGGVTTDGVNPIKSLVSILNEDRKNSKSLSPSLDLDKETIELLQEQGLSLDSIPEKDHFIRLRRIANVSRGGTSIPIPDLSIIHQDNIDLAIRAVSTLRLDIAAVDLIINDLSSSWIKSGAIINEVNAIPQVAREENLSYFLNNVMEGNGRIPVILAFCNHDEIWIEHLVAKAIAQNKHIGVVSHSKVMIDNKIVAQSSFSAINGGLVLLNNPIVDMAIITIDELSMLDRGLSVDKFDIMVLGNSKVYDENMKDWQRVIYNHTTMCEGRIFVNDLSSHWQPTIDSFKNKKVMLYNENTFANDLQMYFNF